MAEIPYRDRVQIGWMLQQGVVGWNSDLQVKWLLTQIHDLIMRLGSDSFARGAPAPDIAEEYPAHASMDPRGLRPPEQEEDAIATAADFDQRFGL